jgi:hypothetical protein
MFSSDTIMVKLKRSPKDSAGSSVECEKQATMHRGSSCAEDFRRRSMDGSLQSSMRVLFTVHRTTRTVEGGTRHGYGH